MRKRATSTWNGIATIVFFSGVFLGVSIFGYSAIMVGIFMWIVGGILMGILFGPKSKRSQRRTSNVPLYKSRNLEESVEVKVNSLQCPGCGTVNDNDSVFCIDCGTSLKATSNYIPSNTIKGK